MDTVHPRQGASARSAQKGPGETQRTDADKKPGPASEEKSSTWQSKVLSSVVGLLVTFAVGDLLLKRNYEAYIAEKKEVQAEIESAAKDFSALEGEVRQLVRERRSISEKLNLYARQNLVTDFMEFYEEYDAGVRLWNERRVSIESRIQSYTRCANRNLDPALQKNLEYMVLDPSSSINVTHSGAAALATRPEWESLRPEDRFCPSHYLFGYRPSADGTSMRTVLEAFQIMHRGQFDNLKRDLVLCFRENEGLVKRKIVLCDRFLTVAEASQCFRDTISEFATRSVCSQDKFGRLAYFEDPFLAQVDYRWNIAQRMLGAYKDGYVRRRCEQKLAFWATYLRWTCDSLRQPLRL